MDSEGAAQWRFSVAELEAGLSQRGRWVIRKAMSGRPFLLSDKTCGDETYEARSHLGVSNDGFDATDRRWCGSVSVDGTQGTQLDGIRCGSSGSMCFDVGDIGGVDLCVVERLTRHMLLRGPGRRREGRTLSYMVYRGAREKSARVAAFVGWSEQ